jgi:hypothetical protein
MSSTVQVLADVLECSQDNSALMCAAVAVRELAGVPQLRAHLGAAGCVAALVRGLRRWVELEVAM